LPKPFDANLLRARLGASLASKRLHDMELETIEQVGHLTRAAAAVEAGTFELDSLSPVAVLGRGYAVCWNEAKTVIIRDEAGVEVGDAVRVTLSRGELECRVEGKSVSD
jgi:exodeoxyribonuclease VII large subunit